VEDESAPVEFVPFTAFVPLHPSDAVQLVALVELHVSEEDPPAATAPGLAVIDTVGTDAVTATLAVAEVVPPLPVQLSTKVEEEVSGPVDPEPLTDLAPLHPSDAVQLVALVEDQVSVDEPPEATVPGLAEMETVGAPDCVTMTEAEPCDVPPLPVQLSAKVVVVFSAPVEAVPLVAFDPLQPPEAVQLVALVEDQVSVEEAPELTVPGLAVIDTLGGGGMTVTVAEF
jgi:hypothetical protein